MNLNNNDSLPHFFSFSSHFNRAESFLSFRRNFWLEMSAFHVITLINSPLRLFFFLKKIFEVEEPQFKYVIKTKERFSVELLH